MWKVTYDDKRDIDTIKGVDEQNLITAANLNEIKSTINNNSDEFNKYFDVYSNYIKIKSNRKILFNCDEGIIGFNNSRLTEVGDPLYSKEAANKKYVDTVGAFLIPDNALGGYYVDGKVVSIVQTELVKDKIFIIEYRTNISHNSSFLNLTCVGACLRGYGENNTFGPTEVYKRDNKVCFILLTQKEKAVQNQNIRLFFMKNKQF